MSIKPVTIKTLDKPSAARSLAAVKAKPIYQIGVISDTHDIFHPDIPRLFQNVNEIWHLGDVCEEDTLEKLRKINSNVTVVMGNNDFKLGVRYDAALDLERLSERFHLVHIPPKDVKDIPPTAKWICFGHTHRPANEYVGNKQIFNPGSAGRANKGSPLSVGYIYWTEGQLARARVEVLKPYEGTTEPD